MVHMVVVSYRTPLDLEAFCWSLHEAPPKIPWSLTIYNVSPQPGDMAVGERWADHLGARHCWDPENIGYARACNAGACSASWPPGDSEGVLAFFNADVILAPGAIDGCAGALLSRPEWGVLGPRQVDNRGRFTHAGIFGSLDRPQHRAWLGSASTKYTDVRDDAVTVSGAAYFIRRSLWDELRSCSIFKQVAPDARGAFLPTQHYYEETWVSYHAQAHGKRVVYWGQDTIKHLWHQASPVGGPADALMPESQRFFRMACDAHGIPHD